MDYPERIWSDSQLAEEIKTRGYKTTRQTISGRSFYKKYRDTISRKRPKELLLGMMQIDTKGKLHLSRDKKASNYSDGDNA